MAGSAPATTRRFIMRGLDPRISSSANLFYFRFLEFDMLARDRIVFLHRQFLGLRARVLFRDIVIAGAGATHELDLQRYCLGHLNLPARGAAARASVGKHMGQGKDACQGVEEPGIYSSSRRHDLPLA